jgi:hypothetical protein
MRHLFTLNIMILLRDDFRIDLAINPMVAVLAWGEAESQYNGVHLRFFNWMLELFRPCDIYFFHFIIGYEKNSWVIWLWSSSSFFFFNIWNQKCSIQYPVLHNYYTAWFSLVRLLCFSQIWQNIYLCRNLNQKYLKKNINKFEEHPSLKYIYK